ncbi:MAG: GGDEF domain-containing protein [Oscillospiraceae bacterium]
MSGILRWFVELNFPTLIALMFMSIFLALNSIFHKKINKIFSLSLTVSIIEMAAYSAELWEVDHGGSPAVCIFFCALGYAVRPIIVYLYIRLAMRNKQISLPANVLLHLPMAVNALAAFSAYFTDIVYTYDSSNNFIRGPLGYTTHIISVFYMLLLLILTVKRFCRRDYSEGLIIFLIVTVNIIAMCMESFGGMYGTNRTAYILSIVFYYLFLSTESFIRDPMTNALNRHCFYIDSERHKEDLSAVISIDLNDLKKINDTGGHAKGDEAICTIVTVIENNLPKGCLLYRTGGDEFMILCVKKDKKDVGKIIKNIRSEMAETPFTCAIGSAFADGGNFDSICAKADAQMYSDKKKYKMSKGYK